LPAGEVPGGGQGSSSGAHGDLAANRRNRRHPARSSEGSLRREYARLMVPRSGPAVTNDEGRRGLATSLLVFRVIVPSRSGAVVSSREACVKVCSR